MQGLAVCVFEPSGERDLPPWSPATTLRGALAALVASTPAACDPFHAEFDPVEPAHTYQARVASPSGTVPHELRVMTYNVKFGGGRIDFFFDCHGSQVLMTEAEVTANLKRLTNVINEADPDVIFLQEVDVNSKRSAYLDQVQWLLDHTQLNHAVYASQWRADFVPTDGIGPVDSGNAILSRWPLADAQRFALALREDQSALVRYFYLRRNLLEASLVTDTLTVRLVNVHAEAYARDGTKRRHIDAFEQHLDAAAKQGAVIGGGDLNALPPGTRRVSGFPDAACEDEFSADDFSGETEWLDSLYGNYSSAIPLDDYQEDNAPYFTHTTDANGYWNRKLDYLFSNRPLNDGRVLQGDVGEVEAMAASDHAPLVADVEVGP